MKEKPILFNTEMVQAILKGNKFMTRQLIKPKDLIGLGCDKCPNNMPSEYIANKDLLFLPYSKMDDSELISSLYKSKYNVGDILYVRETWNEYSYTDKKGNTKTGYFYKASLEMKETLPEYVQFNWGKWKPSLFMPKDAARIKLKITNVCAERLQDITENHIVHEGVPYTEHLLNDWIRLWNSTIKKEDMDCYGWDANPWVYVYRFVRL